jgi:hypothetical protein
MRVFRTQAGLGKVCVGAFGDGVWIAVRELSSHRVIGSLFRIIGLERTFAPIGIIAEMITGTVSHKDLENVRVARISQDCAFRLRPKVYGGKGCFFIAFIGSSLFVSPCNTCDLEIL